MIEMIRDHAQNMPSTYSYSIPLEPNNRRVVSFQTNFLTTFYECYDEDCTQTQTVFAYLLFPAATFLNPSKKPAPRCRGNSTHHHTNRCCGDTTDVPNYQALIERSACAKLIHVICDHLVKRGCPTPCLQQQR